MTVIAAAITKKDGIVMVSDSEITSGWTKDNDGYNKLWVDDRGNFLIGGCGTVRGIQIFKYWVELPLYNGDNPEKFGVEQIAPLLRNALSEHGALTVNKKEEFFEGEFLMAWGDTLIVISSDFSICVPTSGRYATGSGQSEALGHLGNTGPWTKADVIEAARKATITAVGVGGPLWVGTTKSMAIEQV